MMFILPLSIDLFWSLWRQQVNARGVSSTKVPYYCLRNIQFYNMMRLLPIISTIAIIALSCGSTAQVSDTKPMTHEAWDKLVSKHVTESGVVNYKGIIQDSVQFNDYLQQLSSHHPNEANWTRDERLAYWINAYNAFTVKLILDHYPVKSIKDIKKGIPLVNSVWDIQFIEIGGKTYDLNNIEHGILRKEFYEPLIHFAINCASVSCPRLRNEAFNADNIDSQLQSQAMSFLSDPVKNQITADHIRVSKLFFWFKGDFTNNGSLIDFLNEHGPLRIDQDAQIDYLTYDWNLNE